MTKKRPYTVALLSPRNAIVREMEEMTGEEFVEMALADDKEDDDSISKEDVENMVKRLRKESYV